MGCTGEEGVGAGNSALCSEVSAARGLPSRCDAGGADLWDTCNSEHVQSVPQR